MREAARARLRAGVLGLLGAIACACVAKAPAPVVEPLVTPLPRPAIEVPATPKPRPTRTATAPPPAAAPSSPPSPLPSPTATPFVPTARQALGATFRRGGVAAVHALVTAEWDGARHEHAGTTDGSGFARLTLPVLPLPALYRLAVDGRPAGTLFLEEGRRPRVNPTTGWSVEPDLAVEPL